MGFFNNLFGKSKQADKPKQVVKSENWNFYSYTYGEGNAALIEFDVMTATEDEHRNYDTCCRVILFINPDNCISTGLPNQGENKKLIELENEFNASLLVDCRFVGKMSYGAMRELIYQVNDVANFKKKYLSWIKSVPGYKVELKESAGWKFFDEKVKPTSIYWQQIADRRLIGTLIKNGSDPSKPHMLEHTILGNREALSLLSEQLSKEGFEIESLTSDSLVIRKSSLLYSNLISEFTMRLVSYCAKNGLKYDGWGATIENNTPATIYKSIEDALVEPEAVLELDLLNYADSPHPMPKGFGKLVNMKECSIDCSNATFTEIPDEIGNLTKLEILHLRQTYIQKITSEIKNLKNLKEFTLDSKIKQLPNEIGELKSLKKLSLLGDDLETLPETIVNLKELKVIKLSHCFGFKFLPDNFGDLECLENLEIIRGPELINLPESFGNLKTLKSFTFTSAHITRLPESFKNLSSLEKLCIETDFSKSTQEEVEAFFEIISDLENLRFLSISGIKNIPPSIGKMKKLEFLDLGGYGLKSISNTIVGCENWRTIQIEDYADLRQNLKDNLPGGKFVKNWSFDIEPKLPWLQEAGPTYKYARSRSSCVRYVNKKFKTWLYWSGEDK